jgi:hypothetical protein
MSEIYKICTKCGIEKATSFFYSHKTKKGPKDGLSPSCKECDKLASAKYRTEHPEKIKDYWSRWANSEQGKTKINTYREENKDKISARIKEYQNKNKDIIKNNNKIWHEKNKDKSREAHNKWVLLNSDKIKAYRIKHLGSKIRWEENNAEHLKQYFNTYFVDRRKEDELFRFTHGLRTKINIYVRRIIMNKYSDTIKYLGIDIEGFKKHIESKFYDNMSWTNYGKWEIDHKIPLCTGKTKDDLLFLCNYKNLQPLWKKDNMVKGRRLISK